jgi:hypothetical protein
LPQGVTSDTIPRVALTDLGGGASPWQSLQQLAQTLSRTVREQLGGLLSALGHGPRGQHSPPDRHERPASTGTSGESAPAAPSAASPPAGDDLPPTYGRCRAVLVARDPWSLFAHWEVPPARRIEVLRWLDGEGEETREVLRLSDTTSTPLAFHDVELPPGAQRIHLEANPGRTYRAEIGIRTLRGRFIPLATSDLALTPAALPSSDTSVRWVTVADGGMPREAAVAWSGSRVPMGGTATALRSDGPADDPSRDGSTDRAAAGPRASDALPLGPRASDALPIR